MPRIFNYQAYIFDCDGVIFNSNNLKVNAMRSALSLLDPNDVMKCTEYFAANFGLSRYHHIRYFIEKVLRLKFDQNVELYDLILSNYSKECEQLYLHAEINDGFMSFIKESKIDNYVASGSDQIELNVVFEKRNLKKYFVEILGSPKSKKENISHIVMAKTCRNILMFGDAISDLEAANQNHIDFAFMSKYSLSPELVRNSEKFTGMEYYDFTTLIN